MGYKNDGQDGMWLTPNADKRRIRDAENARRERMEISKALSQGKVSRRELIRWGLFSSAGTIAGIGGLSPFVRAQTTSSSSSNNTSGSNRCGYGGGDGGGGTNNNNIPTGLPSSPLFGAQPFTQPMPRFDVLKRIPLAQLPGPTPTLQANTTQQPLNPGIVNGQTGLFGPVEGRPPGAGWAHQIAPFNTFPPTVAVSNPVAGVGANNNYNPGVPSVENSGLGTTYPAQFHPAMPVQSPNAVWTYQGSLPPKLLQVRYGEPILVRQYNNLAPNPTANNGFGRYTLTTHEHNAHHGAENDGFTGAYYWPGQFYDYYYPWVLAGFRSINTGATDPRAGAPNGSGGITNVPGDWHETMSTHWFHDHMFSFTAQNVYKGIAAMNNIYSSLDRGNESINDGVNFRLPSGTTNDWGNLDFDVNLMFADKAFDANGQLTENILAFDGFLGDVMTVNLAYRPFFNVYARKYRFRMLNAAVSRFFVFALSDNSTFTQIANDGNLLPNPVFNMQQTDQLGIAERYDIVIDFSRYSAGQTVSLVNLQQHLNGEIPGPILTVAQALASGGSCDPCVGACLQFKIIGPAPGGDPSQVPTTLIPNPTLPGSVRSRTFVFDKGANQDDTNPITAYQGTGRWGIATENTGGSSRHRGGSALKADFGRVSSQPGYGTQEIWTLVNAGDRWDHPIHIHFEEGQILARNGSASNVPAWEKGRKDVYRLHPKGSVTVALQFRDWGGTFMEHCHNTMHEDNAMLLRWDLDTGTTPFLSPLPTPIPTPQGVTFIPPNEVLPNA